MAFRFGQKVCRLLRYGNRRARLWRLVNRLELRLQRSKLWSYPPFLSIDPCPFCNLHCPCCPTGEQTSKLPNSMMEPETFARIVSHIRIDRVAHASLYRLGEPLLNRHLFDYIRHFSARGIYTAISVNFSAQAYGRDYMESLVRSGLSEIAVSVDGTTQETYAKYRVGGDLSRVLENIRRLAEVKSALQSPVPRIVYKMLLNKFNQHQVEEGRRLAAEFGAEFYQPHFFWTPAGQADEWTADQFRETYRGTRQTYVETDGRHRYVDTECRQMWDTLHVHANGDVVPCCFAMEPKFVLGNLVTQHIDEIWNGEKMQAMRRFVVDPHATLDFDSMCLYCSQRYCTFWKKEQE